jgi:hypothetical protein
MRWPGRSYPVRSARRIRAETSSRRVEETTAPPLKVTAASGTRIPSPLQTD